PASPNPASLAPSPTMHPSSLGSPSLAASSTAASTSATGLLPTNDEVEAVIKMATSTRPTPDGRPPPGKDTRTQLFAGNLPYRVRWQDLKDLFRRAGTVLRADVSLSPDNRSRGYGTVLLASAEDAGRAVDMFNGYSWQGRVLEVRLDRLGSVAGDLDAGLGMGLAVGAGMPTMGTVSAGMAVNGMNMGGMNGLHLPFHCQWQDLKDLFRQAGTILRADVSLGPDGRSRGFGTVSFANEIDAERAVAMFNGHAYSFSPVMDIKLTRIIQIRLQWADVKGALRQVLRTDVTSTEFVTTLVESDHTRADVGSVSAGRLHSSCAAPAACQLPGHRALLF
ncbi:hypothetical protein DFH11DRAFT_1509759, partial [Phellopilus nigrolimitatus]